MAINFWTFGGKPASYNPLPTGWNHFINIEITSYVVKFKAKSTSGASLRVKTDTTATGMNQLLVLTNTLSSFEFSFDNKAPQKFHFYDETSKGDIIIQDIQLVEKPLPKLTINGIDGFLSGKWSLSANARVVDDETLELNSLSTVNDISSLIVPVITGQTYTIRKTEGNGRFLLRKESAGGDSIFSTSGTSSFTFTVDETFKGFLYIRLDNNLNIGTFTFKKPMLNLGSTPTPYSKKTGERMVMPIKPRVKVAKKNLFDGVFEYGTLSTVSGVNSASDNSYMRTKNHLRCLPNATHTISNDKGYSNIIVIFYDEMLNFISFISSGASPYTFTTPSNAKYIRFRYNGISPLDLSTKAQLEQGTQPTHYEPYTEVLPKAKKGLVMDGVTNYLQLPSMTMDSIEIDCLIDAVQVQANQFLIDARTGSSEGFIGTGSPNVGGTISKIFVDDVEKPTRLWTDISKGQRVKVKANFSSLITDDITLFNRYIGANFLKGILYGVKCYLNGQVVASYDFTNPNNSVGDKVLQNAKNLIPSFDSGKWSLHPNFKVLGKDVGRLEASGVTNSSDVFFDVKPNTSYLFVMQNNVPSARVIIRKHDDSLTYRANADYQSGSLVTFTTDSTTNKIYIRLTNTIVGTYDFIRPQLYELTGKEGTIVGSPVSELKAPRRALYAKR
jgi:hypothetical protein